jgi:predicted aspartyl protease
VIEGRVTRNGLPVITVMLKGRAYRALIDTGFNGDLELPSALRAQLNVRYLGPVTSTLAGGISIREEVFLVDFPFDGEMVEAEASFVEGEGILIGTKLLHRHRLEIHFVKRKVRITKAR